MGIWDIKPDKPQPKQSRDMKGRFVRKSKPSPFLNPLKRPHAVRARTKVAQYITTVPRGFRGEPSTPPRPMTLREKPAWQQKSIIRKGKIKKQKTLRRRRTNKILRKAWKTIW